MPAPEIRDHLPVHPSDNAALWPGRLRIDGLVRHPLDLARAAVAALPHHDLTDDFTCLEGWVVPGARWRGIPLATLFEMAGVLPEAHWLQASAAGFSVPLPLDEVSGAMIATSLDGRDLPPEHGGPLRLVIPGGVCYAGIKWLDHLELLREPRENTARSIALARLPGSPEHRTA
jgi:DMSO/TMAO reductase YedYZ molybdopterin-dependent catalytic subunit